MLVTDSRIRDLSNGERRQSCLSNGGLLTERSFEIKKDPSQEKDVAADHPQQVKMRFLRWVVGRAGAYLSGDDGDLPWHTEALSHMTCHDWIGGTPRGISTWSAAMGYRPKFWQKKQTGGDSSEASGSFWAVKC